MWYSAPTAFRMLMAVGESVADKYDFSTIMYYLLYYIDLLFQKDQ